LSSLTPKWRLGSSEEIPVHRCAEAYGYGLPDQIEGQEPNAQRKFGGLHDRTGREGGLMAEVAALITLELPAVDEAMPMAFAAGAAEPIGPASLRPT